MKYRSLPLLSVRGVDKSARKATYVAATERGVETWEGREYLLMRGALLERYEANPVILDAHRMDESNRVVGRATILEREPELVVEVEYATTKRAEEVWTLVRDGFIRALSVGFNVDDSKTVYLREGEIFEDRIQGPGLVQTSWELFEISQVPVPADAAALKRGKSMPLEEGESQVEDQAQVDAPLVEESEKRREVTAAKPSDDEPGRQRGDVMSRKFKEQAEQIRAIAPRGMEDLADRLVVDGVSIDEARSAFRGELEKRHKPAGSPEPTDVATSVERIRSIDDQTWFEGLTSGS